MKREVKFIELGFEDRDKFVIKTKDIEYMEVNDISESHLIDEYTKKFVKTKYCGSFNLCINKRIDGYFESYIETSEETIFQRILESDDLVYVTYLDGNKNPINSIYLQYKDISDENCENLYQHSNIDKDGNLRIIVEQES